MLDDVPQLDEIDDVLDALSSPDSLEVYEDVLPYDDTMLIAAAIRIAVNAAGGGGGGGAPDSANYLVGTANGGLSAEIVVGTTPGGELGGTWAVPTVDSTHSGSSHASVQSAAEATAAAALSAHTTDVSAAHAASAVSFTPNGSIAATDVQAAIQEVRDEAGAGSMAATAVTVDSTTLVGTGTDAQAVFEELDNAVVAAEGVTAAHISDSSAAHAASAISADSTTLVGTGTDVQAVFEELDNAIVSAEAATTAHVGDATDAHAGTAITNTPAGAIAATTVQAAINELDTEKQPLDATLTALAAANWAANSVPVGTGADALSQTAMGASTILARLAAGNVVAATPTELRTLLALVIGTNVQAWDADLDTYAGITPAANTQSLLGAANYAAMRTLLTLVVGTDVQAFDADLLAIAGLTSAANKGIQFTGSGTAGTYDLTTAGKALLDDADASAQLTTLGVSTFIKTLLDDADAATARATLGVTLGFAMIGIP